MPIDEEYVAPEPQPPQYHYTVPLTGTGTEVDPFRPDVPEGTSFCVIGQPLNGVLLVVVPVELPTKTGRQKQLPRQAIEAVANARGISYEQVLTGWRVSG